MNIVSSILGLVVIGINIFFVIQTVSTTDLVHEWYYLLPIALFGVFYVIMCAYLLFHTFLSMVGDRFFANSDVSRGRFQVDLGTPNGLARKPMRGRLKFLAKYFYNDFKVYDRMGRRCDSAQDSLTLEEFQMLLGDSSDSEFSTNPNS